MKFVAKYMWVLYTAAGAYELYLSFPLKPLSILFLGLAGYFFYRANQLFPKSEEK